jgi:mono/diheme cytochrome c family protein
MSPTRERRRSLLGRVVRGTVWCAGVGALAALTWLLVAGVSARTPPGSLETAVARTARNWAIPRAARALTNPEPQSPENLRDGLAHFADHCASCHANNGAAAPVGRGRIAGADMRLPAARTSDELFYLIEEDQVHGHAGGAQARPMARASWLLVQFIRALRGSPAQLDQMRI